MNIFAWVGTRQWLGIFRIQDGGFKIDSRSKDNGMINNVVHNALFGGGEFNYENIGPLGIIMMT